MSLGFSSDFNFDKLEERICEVSSDSLVFCSLVVTTL